MRHGKIGTAQGTKVRNSESEFSRLMRMRNIMNPPILATIYGNSTEISQISRKISRFQRRFHGFHERFQDFNGDFTDFTKDFKDFTKDFRISTEISGFRERFQISREISGKVYEISVSGGPLGLGHGNPRCACTGWSRS